MRKMLSKTTSSGETAFPWKLHMVLDESAFGGYEDTISWIGDTAFKVHDPIKFEETIMQRYFNQTQYKSFQRQRKFISPFPSISQLISPDQNDLTISSFLFVHSQHLWLRSSQDSRKGNRILLTSTLHPRKPRCLLLHGSNQD